MCKFCHEENRIAFDFWNLIFLMEGHQRRSGLYYFICKYKTLFSKNNTFFQIFKAFLQLNVLSVMFSVKIFFFFAKIVLY